MSVQPKSSPAFSDHVVTKTASFPRGGLRRAMLAGREGGGKSMHERAVPGNSYPSSSTGGPVTEAVGPKKAEKNDKEGTKIYNELKTPASQEFKKLTSMLMIVN